MAINNSSIVDSAWDSAMNSSSSQPAAPQSAPAPKEIADPQSLSSESNIDEPLSAEAQPSSPEVNVDTSEAPQAKADTSEYIYVTGPNGREKVKVDFSKEATKKYAAAAYGMRKFQAERDNLKSEISKYKEKASNFDKFEELWKQGPEALLNTLDPQALDRIVQSRVERIEKRKNASEDEIRLMDLEEREAIREKENQKLREQVEKNLQEAKQREEAAQIKQLESRVYPQFHKYSFDGKLGDAKVEDMYNKFLWNHATKTLSEYPESVEITPAMIEKEFREVALNLKKVIATKSEEVASKTIAAKKVAARENAGAQVTKASSGSLNNSIRDDLKKGNTGSAFDKLFNAFNFNK